MALPRPMRFGSRREAARIARGPARRFSVRLGRVVARKHPGRHSRILFIVSKAVAKQSTKRNRLKRVLDEMARKRLAGVPGYDIVVFVNREARADSPLRLEEEVDELKRAVQREHPRFS